MQKPTLPATITLLNSSGVVKPTAAGWLIRCPAHKDTSPSLSLTERDGKLLIDCFAGCTADAVMAAVGLGLGDLFESRPSRPAPAERKSSGRLVRERAYVIAPGIEHIRREYSDGSKGFSWRRDGKDGLGGLPSADLPLYGLQRIGNALAPGADGTVFVCEGEKAADALWEQGWVAVATVTGASGCPTPAVLWDAFGDPARFGQIPVLWPDNDAPGLKHMERVARNLPSGCTPFVVRIPQAQSKDDAADYTGSIDDLFQHFTVWTPNSLFDERKPTPRPESDRPWGRPLL